MLKKERQNVLLEIINKEKVVTIADLTEHLDVSHMTLWRDLDELAQAGIIQRIRGGAMAIEHESYEIPGSFKRSPDPHKNQKTNIGQYAAEHLVNEGEFITIEAGTTASSMVPFLNTANLTVLTNGLLTSLLAFQANQNITLMCSGGVLIKTGAFTGPQAEEFFTNYRVHKAFLGASGLTIEDGFTDPTPLYLGIKKAMIANADQIILMLDSSKLDVRSLLQVVPFNDVDKLVIDAGISDDLTLALQKLSIEVHIVGQQTETAPR